MDEQVGLLLEQVMVDPADLVEFPGNPRVHADEAIQESLTELGLIEPVTVRRLPDGRYQLLGGHGTARNYQQTHPGRLIQASIAPDVDDLRAKKAVAVLNRTNDLAGYDDRKLLALLDTMPDLAGSAFTEQDREDLRRLTEMEDKYGGTGVKGALAAEFLVAPFTVLDTTSGWWRSRKTEWRRRVPSMAGHATRDDAEISQGGLRALADAKDPGRRYIDGVSVFDPVLAELVVRWWSAPGDVVLDPFAGGPVRGVVTGCAGREYHGVDLRAEQVQDDEDVAVEYAGLIRAGTGDTPGILPSYYVGDAAELGAVEDLPGLVDLVFTCPPYGDLEKYSDDPLDLSNMSWPAFLEAHTQAITAAADRLRPDRFMVWVVGEVRDGPRGQRGLVPATIRAMQDAGLGYHGDAVLVTSVASMALSAGRIMRGTRTLTRRHQNVIIGVKGSAKRATDRLQDLVGLDEALAAVESPAEED